MRSSSVTSTTRRVTFRAHSAGRKPGAFWRSWARSQRCSTSAVGLRGTMSGCSTQGRGCDMETEKLLKPIRETGIGFYAAAGALSVVALWMLAAWLYQLRNGLIVTGLRDWGVGYGAPWGVYIATFVWYIGIAHGGIAISAAIRLLRLETYKPIARIAEVVTVISLMMAGANITFDIGRPDRIFNMIVNYWSRVGHSPLVWDVTVILIYMVLSISYLVISMRDDIAALRRRLPALFAPLYALVLFGYHPEEREKREQILWWLALALICLMTLLSGGDCSHHGRGVPGAQGARLGEGDQRRGVFRPLQGTCGAHHRVPLPGPAGAAHHPVRRPACGAVHLPRASLRAFCAALLDGHRRHGRLGRLPWPAVAGCAAP